MVSDEGFDGNVSVKMTDGSDETARFSVLFDLTIRYAGWHRSGIMRLTTIRYLVFVSVLILTLMVLACGGGDDPDADAPAPTTERADSQSSRATAPPAAADGEPTVLGECADGMTMQPGEGCQFNGDEGRPADVVISVGANGEICREKGSVMMSGFTVGVIRACGDRFEIIDVFEAEITFAANGDGSWTVSVQ